MADNGRLRSMNFNETFESSLLQHSHEKFTIEKSLAKGIMENDVSKIINTNEDGGVEDKKELFDELHEIEGIVISTRKAYDETKTKCQKSQQEIDKLKRNLELLQADENKYNGIITKQRNDLEATKKKLEQVTHGMEATVFRRDIYDYMKDTLKKDILVLKKRFLDRDIELARDKTKLKSIRIEHSNKIKLSKQCRTMLESVERTVNSKQFQRTAKVQSVHEVLDRKQANMRNRQIRDREIQEVMVSAMTDKLSEEKEWTKILSTNIFLKNVLKSKMERLMGQFGAVELSFHKMKQATSIKDCNDFIEKFLGREETYGMLLDSIAEKQTKLDNLKQEKETLQKSHSDLIERGEAIMEENKATQKQPVNLDPILLGLNERLLKISRQKQLIYSWGTKFLASFQGCQTRGQLKQKYSRTQIKELFTEIIKILNTFITDTVAQESYQKKVDEAFMKNTIKNSTLTEDYYNRNARVKTMSAFETESGGPQTFEDKDMMYDDLSEVDFLQYNRRAIKKNEIQNRKFRIKTKPN